MIQCKQLTKEYHRGDNCIRPLHDLDLEIQGGRFLALMGPSGSGKTTLLNLIAGIDKPTSGSLVINDMDIAALSASRLANWRSTHIGYIFQLYNLIPVLTAYENIELPLLLHNMSRQQRHERITHALKLVGLEDRYDHYPRQLSGGQEQRVAIARAIVTNPKILVADEPTGDLDRQAAFAIMELLQQLNKELQTTLIMVTHDPQTAQYADQVLFLNKGKLVEHQEQLQETQKDHEVYR
ncbi:MAG: ABC transporter ATP-binding protein [Planctomycetota bacterium]|jgi:putative ABC transport system ATP-binding protein